MEPQPAGATPAGLTGRVRTVIWVAVAAGAAAALIQVLLRWGFDLRAEHLVDVHTEMMVRSGRTDAVIIWLAAPVWFYVVQLAVWAVALVAMLVAALATLRGKPAGRVVSLVLAAVFAVANVGFGALYGVSMSTRIDEIYGGEIPYPGWMYQLAVAACGLSAAAAVTLLVVLAKLQPADRRSL